MYGRISSVLLVSAALAGAGCAGLSARSQEKALDESTAKILPVLIQSLQHEKAETRLRSVQAIETLGPAAHSAAKDLVFLLDDPSAPVRDTAADALVKIGPRAVPALTDAVADARFPSVRKEAIPVLARMGRDAKSALPVLDSLADSEDEELKSLARAAGNVIGRGRRPAQKKEENAEPPPPARLGAPGTAREEDGRAPPPARLGAPGTAREEDGRAPPPPPPAPKIEGPIPLTRLLSEMKSDDPSWREAAVAALAFGPEHSGEALPVLVHIALNDTAPAVRTAAAAKLKNLGAQSAPALILALNHAEPSVRQNAVDALGRLGPVTSAVIPALVDSLGDEKARVRSVEALSGIGLKAVAALVSALKNDAVAPAAMTALTSIGRPAAPALAKALDDASLSPRASDVLSAIGAEATDAVIASFETGPFQPRAGVLVRIGRPAVPALVRSLRTGSEKARQGSGLALCEIGPAAGDSAAAFIEVLKKHPSEMALYPVWRFGSEGLPALLDAAGDKEPDIRLFAWRSIARLRPVPPESFPALIRALYDSDGRITELAAALIKDAGEAAVPALAAALSEKNPRTGRAAAEALGFLGEPAKKALDELRTALLRNPDSGVRKRSAYAIGRLGRDGRAAVKDLVEALGDDPVRWWASDALVKIGQPSASYLSRAVRDERDPNRVRSAILLSRIEPDNDKVGDVLVAGLASEDSGVRYQSAIALGKRPSMAVRGLQPLLTALSDPDSGVRFAAAHALGRAGAPAAPALLKLASSPDAALAEAAKRGLLQLDASAAEALTAGLADPETAAAAQAALLRLGDGAIVALVEALGPDGPEEGAGRLLAGMGDSAVPALAKALEEGKDAARKGAALVLRKIGTPAAAAALR